LVSSLESLHAYIACPARSRPQLLVLEIGNRADLDRALIVLDWNEHVQPLAATRYVLLMGSKHLSLGDRAAKLASAEIATLPQPTRNILFKLELQTRLLRTAPPPVRSKEGFSAKVEERPGTSHRRVLVVRGPNPKEGSWNRGEGTPSGKIRWRWVKSPGTPPAATDHFQWRVDSRQAPRFEESSHAWLAESDDEAACVVDGKTLYSVQVSEVIHANEEEEKSGRSEKFISPLEPVANTAATAALAIASSRPPAMLSRDADLTERTEVSGANTPPKPAAISGNLPLAESEAAAETGARAQKHRAKEPATSESATSTAAAQDPEADSADISSEEAEASEAMLSKPGAPPKAAAEVAHSAAVSRARAALEQAKSALNSETVKEATAKPGSVAKQSGNSPLSTEKTAPQSRGSANSAVGDPEKPDLHSVRISPAAETEKRSNAPNPAADPMPPPLKREPLPELGEPVPELTPAKTSDAASARAAPPAPRGGIPEMVPTPGRNWIEGEKASARGMRIGGDPLNEEPSLATDGVPTETTEKLQSVKTVQATNTIASSTIPAGEPEPAEELRRIHPGTAPEPRAPKVSSYASMGPVVAEADQRGRARNPPEPDDARRFLKTRHYLLMTLEQLGDRDSSWHPMGKHRVYLSAQHRYYGLKDPSQALPLWIYEGELAPEFIDEQASWKFYDCLPIRIDSLNALPAEAFDALYRLCGLEPPVEVSAQPRGSSVVHVKKKNTEALAAEVSRVDATAEAEGESAWSMLKRAVKGILK
jgi:hypothetical protein